MALKLLHVNILMETFNDRHGSIVEPGFMGVAEVG